MREDKKLKFHNTILFELLLLTASIIFISMGVSLYTSLKSVDKELKENIGRELLGIINTTGTVLDASKHEDIFFDAETGEILGQEELDSIHSVLKDIEIANKLKGHGDDSSIYTLRKSIDFDEDGMLQFVAMSKKQNDGSFFTGALIKAMPHHLDALKGKHVVSDLYEDEEGTWISAIIPLLSESGDIVALVQADRNVTYYKDKKVELIKRLLASAIIGFIISIIPAIYFARGFSKPFSNLVKAMSEVGSGNLQYRTDVTKSNEVGILQIEVNSMAEHLEELNTKRKALFDKIQDRNHELQHFAHIAAHDLQEPLRMITSYLQLLQRRHTENFDDEAKEFMGFVIGGANRMQALIQALHAYSSVESDKEANPLIDVNSKDIVDWAVDNVSLLVKDKGATVNVTGITPDLYVCKVQVAQVLQNLLGNALKYCPEDRTPEVTVDVKDIGSHIQFSVKDNGIGIEEQYYQKIFEVFRRLHGSGEFSGTGMGLSVCKRIVDRHKGKIWVESKFGEGSTFYFTVSKKIENKANE